MNRTDRLLAMLLELRSRKLCRAEDLAEQFEISVRTVYRDMLALSEAGVPICAVPGQGYSLMEGYFLPPVSLLPEEAILLLCGGELVESIFYSPWKEHARTAHRKIEALLSSSQRDQVDELRQQVRILPAPYAESSALHGQDIEADTRLFGMIREGVQENRVLQIDYHGKRSGRDGDLSSTRRKIHPYGLIYVGGGWVLVAYCELRQDMRHFRLDRIGALLPTEEKFLRDPNFSLTAYKKENDRTVQVRVCFTLDIAPQVLASRYFYIDSYVEQAERLLVTLLVRREDEVLSWILGWGHRAKVLEPASLVQRIEEEIAALQKVYMTSALLT
ncbi:YafY family transcriptional regulator [Paenibacillus profundus]|uniref:YafY family transcriptional regulator n=1 Tax=Paenibacillus profundus TaxID=1173085 RepID=A0ABS8YHU3_9BACL|nr:MULTISPECIES: YafY family protein [Paenibacillus]MCE5171331.1 YafY family transcriptional regulator [Paenibacillus profundus]MCM3340469.1 YafY family transcriptional regulator [Paenibacillus sp. MER TA 81-3]